jgi:hypothetical protein
MLATGNERCGRERHKVSYIIMIEGVIGSGKLRRKALFSDGLGLEKEAPMSIDSTMGGGSGLGQSGHMLIVVLVNLNSSHERLARILGL